ncbi:hypothetical protein ASF40_09210 [Microbacterium sp. Leaf288]|nr:hypothetical protein ASF40_09210 [Microbacterium sp. Leaf288]
MQFEGVPGLVAAVPWLTVGGAIDFVSDRDPAPEGVSIPSFPYAGETILRVADFPPDADYPAEASTAIFAQIDGTEGESAHRETSARHFWFHRTDSLDYAVVLSGEITLLVDDGETTLRAGDVVVQRATNHAWSNRTNESARVLFVLIGTPSLPADEIAHARKARREGDQT